MALALMATACARAPVNFDLRGPEADRRIVELVQLRLSSDQRLCSYQIGVVSVDRTVRLEGNVGSSAERRRAEEVALRAGAFHVVNHLGIDPSSGDRGRC